MDKQIDKSRKIKDLSKNTALFTIGSFGAKFIALFLVPLYTYVLTTSEYGSVDVITTTVQLLIPILTLNIQDAVLRFALDKDFPCEDAINIGLKTIGLTSVLLGAVLIVIHQMDIIPLGYNYMLFLYVSYIGGSVNNVLTMYLKAKDCVSVIAIWGLVNTVITCCSNVLLLLVVHLGVNGYMISYASGTLIADFGMFLSGKVYIDLKASKNNKLLFKEMLVYSLPLIANSLGWWVNNASDRYILTYFCGTAVNGLYSVSYKIPGILSTIQTVFYNAWSVSAITEFDRDDEDGFIGNVFSAYSGMSYLACSFIMLFIVFIADILFSKDFFQAWQFVPFLLVGTVFNGIGLFIGCIFTAVKMTRVISITTVLGAGVNTILNFVLIPELGALGAAIATMVGYFSICFIRLMQSRRIIVMKVNWNVQGVCIALLITQSIISTFTGSIGFQIPFFFALVLIQWKMIKSTANQLLAVIKSRADL